MAEATKSGTARPRVLVAGVVARRRQPSVEMLAALVAAGGSGVLVIADGTTAATTTTTATTTDVPAGIEVIDLSGTERRLGLHPLIAGRATSRVSRGVWRRYRASRPYKAIRGWVMWRALRRHLDEVAVEELDHVILVDLQSWPIAWQLNHLNPAVTIGWDVPEELFERVGRPRQQAG